MRKPRISCNVCNSRAHAAHPAGPIVPLGFLRVSVYVSVRLSQLGEASPLRCKRKLNDASNIDKKGTALVTEAQYSESSPRSMGMARKQPLTTTKPRSENVLVLQYSVSQKRAPWSSKLHVDRSISQNVSVHQQVGVLHVMVTGLPVPSTCL